jgi:hypothetical protein
LICNDNNWLFLQCLDSRFNILFNDDDNDVSDDDDDWSVEEESW